MRIIAVIAGAFFGAGAAISGMVRSSKVIAFLDFGGAWDPSLALVLGTGLAINAIAWRYARAPRTPLYGEASYPGPPSSVIDARLVGGAVVFGLGWGLGGFCPGPAFLSMVSLVPGTLLFGATMVAGMALARAIMGTDRGATRKLGDAA